MPNDVTQASGQTPTDAAAPVVAATPAPGNLLADPPAAVVANDAAPAAPAAAAPADGEKPAEGEGDKAKEPPDAEKPAGAPEAYADFTAPEGVTLDADVTGEFKDFAKQLNLPQETAQQVVDMGAKLVQRVEAKRAEAVAQELASWAQASRTDKEFGGEALDANLAVAKAALTQFGSPELKEMLDNTGLGSHPEVIRLLHRVGKAVSEDNIVGGKPGATAAASMAQRMYPGMNP